MACDRYVVLMHIDCLLKACAWPDDCTQHRDLMHTCQRVLVPQPHAGGADGVEDCNQCPEGTSLRDKVCKPCVAGTYMGHSNVGSPCAQCSMGASTAGMTGATTCTWCARNYFAASLGTWRR